MSNPPRREWGGAKLLKQMQADLQLIRLAFQHQLAAAHDPQAVTRAAADGLAALAAHERRITTDLDPMLRRQQQAAPGLDVEQIEARLRRLEEIAEIDEQPNVTTFPRRDTGTGK